MLILQLRELCMTQVFHHSDAKLPVADVILGQKSALPMVARALRNERCAHAIPHHLPPMK